MFNIQHILHVNSRSRSSAGWPIKCQGTPSRRGVPTGSTIITLGWSEFGSLIQDLSGSWGIKGTGESTLVTDSPVPLMHHDPDRSWITDPNSDLPKGTHPRGTSVLIKRSGGTSQAVSIIRCVVSCIQTLYIMKCYGYLSFRQKSITRRSAELLRLFISRSFYHGVVLWNIPLSRKAYKRGEREPRLHVKPLIIVIKEPRSQGTLSTFSK